MITPWFLYALEAIMTGYNLFQKIVALLDIRGVAREPQITAGERRMHVVVLVRRDPVIVGYCVIGQIGE
jgi:hypothetical protein